MAIKSACLLEWVKKRYEGKIIPLSNVPYIHHVSAVAEIAANYTAFGYEAGLCHDMLEDGICSNDELISALSSCSYSLGERNAILGLVLELTDHYTCEAYPELSKKERQRKENKRLRKVSPAAQTVKYADLLYNMDWKLRYEPEKVHRYLKRKIRLLERLDKGSTALHQKVLDHAYSLNSNNVN
ncbi:hypothetical protein SAMN05192574_104782 [Mucilaginibacter gossypiicola]|uniref:HD domain-containing protein n=1 Tax=Mucilaginibacter gossypiicola TaxID=551995 RepID=A0A1H8KVI8_9SPHI|nr:hypothetical protein [Mucilaginibacter gossypiicola]SEN96428.1 hypothetical protein SAMN05192574_104782 [Mucilaginibacter gossypiicola]